MQVLGSLVTAARFVEVAVALPYAPTIACDASLGNLFRVTLTGPLTLANPVNLADSQLLRWELIQDAVGGRALSLGPMFAFGSDLTSAPLSSAPNKRDFLGAVYNAALAKLFVIAFTRGY